MLSKSALCLALSAPATVLLHGCGGGGTTTVKPITPAPTTTTTTTPSPTTTSPPTPPTPWEPATAVKVLNAMYMDFDETNDESGLGVTISMAGIPTSFDANLFCAPLMDTQCYKGEADCRMSATLFNHKVVVSGNQFVPTMSRPVGYVFSQNLTESYFGKCSYIWDGESENNVNGGCGAGRGGHDCGDPLSAFANQCNQHTCTRSDVDVESRMCKCEPPICSETYGSVPPPSASTDDTCFYEMPNLVHGNPTQTNHLRDSLKQRVALQSHDASKTSQWNEVVIDNMLLIPSIRSDPANTILAFVCVPSATPDACHIATQMRDDFNKEYSVPGTGIPVVAIDTTLDFTASGGPFVVPSQDSLVFA